jgi:DNA-binding SARP family transcriptional activator
LIEFRILGSLEVLRSGIPCTPTAPKTQQTLVLLLLRANRVVPTSSLVEELWEGNPPASAVTTAQTYISQIRKVLRLHARTSDDGAKLITRSPGYLLTLREGQLDLHTFTRLFEQGRTLFDQGHIEGGAEQLRRAGAIWRGPEPIPEVPRGALLQAHLALLEEERIRSLALRIQADMALQRYHDLIGELRSLVVAYPLNEWMHMQLITALHAVGRRGEALEACMKLRHILQSELGVDLSLEVRQLQQRILMNEAPKRDGMLIKV